MRDATRRIAQERERERAARLRERLAARRTILRERDTSIAIPPRTLDRVESAIRWLLPEDILEDYSADPRAKKSGPLTYRDVAFVACVHRLSVTENGRAAAQYRGTSPFKRIAKASVSLGHREAPFDNRQIRFALAILEELGFTEQVTAAVHRPGGKGASVAGRWTISEAPSGRPRSTGEAVRRGRPVVGLPT